MPVSLGRGGWSKSGAPTDTTEDGDGAPVTTEGGDGTTDPTDGGDDGGPVVEGGTFQVGFISNITTDNWWAALDTFPGQRAHIFVHVDQPWVCLRSGGRCD